MADQGGRVRGTTCRRRLIRIACWFRDRGRLGRLSSVVPAGVPNQSRPRSPQGISCRIGKPWSAPPTSPNRYPITRRSQTCVFVCAARRGLHKMARSRRTSPISKRFTSPGTLGLCLVSCGYEEPSAGNAPGIGSSGSRRRLRRRRVPPDSRPATSESRPYPDRSVQSGSSPRTRTACE